MNRKIGRRHLLALGAASGAAAMLPGLASARSAPASSVAGIGYVIGSETGAGLGLAPSWLGTKPIVVAPASTVAPDTSLTGALLDIMAYGLFPGVPADGALSAVGLDAMFSSFSKPDKGPFPFSAWSLAGGNPPRSSSRVAFKMPVDTAGSLTFSLASVEAGTTRSLPEVLSLGGRGAAKLRPGFYLLGLRGTEFASQTVIDPMAQPDWSLTSLVLSVMRAL